jgi:hypothetical protein
MECFAELRVRAAAKRARMIQNADREYQQTMQAIELLEKRLGNVTPALPRIERPLIDLLMECLPDEPFTIAELVDRMQAAEPNRLIRRKSVDRLLLRLRNRGTVQATGSQGPAMVFVLAGNDFS